MRITFAAFIVVTATAPLFAEDQRLILRRDGEQLVIADERSQKIVASAPAATTNRIVIRGGSGTHNDTLTVDLTQPIALSGGIDYDGGAEGWDTLVLRGGSARKQRVTQLTPHDGVIDLDGLVIRYTNLEPLTDTIATTNYLIVGTAGFDNVGFADGPGGTTTVSSSSFESVSFANKTNVVFDGNGGGDTVNFNNPNPATGLVSLIVTNVATVHQTGVLNYSALGINALGLVDLQDLGNDVDRVEITTQQGHIAYHDANDLIVGGVSSTLAGVRTVQSGNISVQSIGGNLVLDDTNGAEIIRSGSVSGDIVLNGFDISVAVNRSAAISPMGFVSIQARHDLLLGTGGATFANDIRAGTSVTMTVLGTLSAGGLTTIMSDAFGFDSGANVTMFLHNLTETGGARIVAAGTNAADVEISSGTGEFSFLGTVVGVQSNTGDVRLLSRGLTIAPTSGITAALGRVEILAHGMSLGTVVDVPDSPIELSDAELDRISAPVVVIQGLPAFSAVIDVTQPITFTSGTQLILRTPEYVNGSGAASLSAPVLTFEIPKSTAFTWTITPASIQTGPGAPIPYSGVGTLNALARHTSTQFIFPATANDTFFAAPHPTTTINIDGHLPTPPATPGDILDFDLTGVVNPVLTAVLTANGYQGSLTSANRQPLNFQAIEQLVDAPVNLGITKTDGASTAVAGTPVSYTIVVTNPAALAVAGATVTDAFPATLTGIAWTCAPSAGSTCTAAGSGDINDIVTLAANGSVTYQVTATIRPSATGTLSNTATVTTPAGFTETDASNNSATDATPLTTEANLIVGKTADSGTLHPSGDISYTITLRNAGPSDAQSVSLSDVLPANTVFVSLTAAAGYVCVTPLAGAPGTVTCTRAVLPPSATADSFALAIHATPAAISGGTITNSVTATSATPDPSPANTASAALTTLTGAPTLSTMMMVLLAALLAIVALRAVR